MGEVVLPKEFYLRPTVEVAKNLIGKALVRRVRNPETGSWQVFGGEIVETEAYLQEGDPASHSRSGPTQRNEAMFGEPGTAYVYFIYGNHFCFNVVTQKKGVGEAVLIRALRPLMGQKGMLQNRLRISALSKGLKKERDLSNGPGKLCQAMLIDKDLNHHSLLSSEGPLFISDLTSKVFSGLSRKAEKGSGVEGCREPKRMSIGCSKRIGISRGSELPYRFFQQECEWVSS